MTGHTEREITQPQQTNKQTNKLHRRTNYNTHSHTHILSPNHRHHCPIVSITPIVIWFQFDPTLRLSVGDRGERPSLHAHPLQLSGRSVIHYLCLVTARHFLQLPLLQDNEHHNATVTAPSLRRPVACFSQRMSTDRCDEIINYSRSTVVKQLPPRETINMEMSNVLVVHRVQRELAVWLIQISGPDDGCAAVYSALAKSTWSC